MRTFLLVGLILALASSSADARRRHHHGDAYIDAPQDLPETTPLRARDPRPRLPQAEQTARDEQERLIPSGWRLQPPDPDWHGRRYVSPIGDAWLAIYQSPAAQEPLSQHLKAVAFVEGEEITYLHGERDWLVVSGIKGDRIFYRKVSLACDKRTWEHVAFEYPAETKRAFDGLVTRSARVLARKCNVGSE